MNLRAVCVSGSTISITWDPPHTPGGRSDLVYRIMYEVDGSGIPVDGPMDLRSTFYRITGTIVSCDIVAMGMSKDVSMGLDMICSFVHLVLLSDDAS